MWLVCVLLFTSLVAGASSNNCRGVAQGLAEIHQAPVLVSTVEGGKLFKVTDVEPNLLIAHIYGEGKARGLAYGNLLKPYLKNVADLFFQWVEDEIETAVMKYVPKDIADLIAIYGLDAVLDLQYELMKNHMSDAFKAEVEGVAEASGISHALIMRLTVFADLVKAHCSIVGAWGSAVDSDFADSLVQLRALDWATDSPLQQFPLVTVYHSNSSAFSTLGWPLFLGALTGMSSQPVGICEKVWLQYDGPSRRNGVPFTLMLRDILEFDGSIEEALNRMQSVKRTCSIWVGVGAPNTQERFTIVNYSRDNVTHYNDNNLEVSNAEHPQLPDVIYVDKHVQPSHDPCLGSLLTSAHGSITPRTLIDVTAQLQTGDTHAAVYDFKNMLMHVSNASPYVNGTFTPAYNRAFIELDMVELFAEQE